MKETILLRTLCGCQKLMFIFNNEKRITIPLIPPYNTRVSFKKDEFHSEFEKRRDFEYVYKTNDGFRVFEEIVNRDM